MVIENKEDSFFRYVFPKYIIFLIVILFSLLAYVIYNRHQLYDLHIGISHDSLMFEKHLEIFLVYYSSAVGLLISYRFIKYIYPHIKSILNIIFKQALHVKKARDLDKELKLAQLKYYEESAKLKEAERKALEDEKSS